MEHDASAALAADGRLVAAVSEERLSRKKGQWGYPWRAADACLKMAGISRADVDVFCVALNKFPACYFRKPSWWREAGEKWNRLRRQLAGRPEEITVTMSDLIREVREGKMILADLFDWERFRADGFKRAEVRFVDHHYAHAHSAACFSGFDRALVLTVDCVGACCAQDETGTHTLESVFLQNLMPLSHTTSVWSGRQLRRFCMTDINGSPGSFYGSVTEALGFISPRHEGKVTGLAAWGKTTALDEPFRRVLGLSRDKTHFVSEQIHERCGNISEARKAVIRRTMQGQSREEVSGSAQRILEEAILGHVAWALKETGMSKVAMAGGVFGNVKLNQHIMELPGVESIFVFPAMSDAGLAAAAAQLGTMGQCEVETVKLADVYLGPSFSNEEVERVLAQAGFPYEKVTGAERAQRAARFIADGGVLGLFQGRMEYGPRALGNRTILASPCDAKINDDLNRRLSRSEFMPFAPSVLAEACPGIFENFERGAHAAEFMTVTYKVRREWQSRIPAVVHVDGTARPQAVHREKNPRYYDILKAYEKLTGLPVAVNTSFNVHEEPIVCRPEEAVQALREERIDALLIEDFWVSPKKA
ncbi:MAG: carbamoyltransferase C-terminal domain-containing protein [Verrucomicrobiae bacterium]|nr:carbamoyltransferase C-terminal domain-containing protein [Verrucomicrobiae bacterium]